MIQSQLKMIRRGSQLLTSMQLVVTSDFAADNRLSSDTSIFLQQYFFNHFGHLL